MNNLIIGFQEEIIIHISMILLISLSIWYANKQKGFLRFSYSITGILIFFYSQFIKDTMFEYWTEPIYILMSVIIDSAIYIITGYFIFLGIYYLFKRKE